jgi:methyl-accepting chemotaxis protein/ABC-type amino acid transport substrate-binding protein
VLAAAVLGRVALAADDDAAPVRVDLTEEERDWLAKHPHLTFGPAPNWPPYEFFDEQGVFSGIAAEHIALVADRLGVHFDFIQKPTWADVVEAVKRREIDCYTTAVATPDRLEYMLFTRPHVSQPGVILARTDSTETLSLKALHERKAKVAVVKGYFWEEELARDYPGIVIVPAADIENALAILSFGTVDAMVNDPATSSYYIRDMALTNVRIAGRTPKESHLSIGVRKDWPILRDIFDKALATITPADYEAIERRWVRFDVSELESEFPWALTLGILFVVVVLVGGVFAWNRTLKGTVSRQTDELRRELQRREEVHRAVARTTIEVTRGATRIAGSARQQADTAATFESSAAHAATAVQAIARTLEALLQSVEGINRVARQTTERAEAGREQLQQLDGVMRVMADANLRMGERVQRVKKSAEKIKLATVMMVKVVDQTNLLSVNSAIEAEKAGEHGRGFRVVSGEIQRLADQSADATLQIEEIVRDMQLGVDEAVHEAEETRTQVGEGVEQAAQIGEELRGIMQEVGQLSARFEEIRRLVSEQSSGTEAIERSIRQVHDGAEAVSSSSRDFSAVADHLQKAIDSLRTDVSTLRKPEDGPGLLPRDEG